MQQSSLTPETQRGCASPCETLQPRASRISGRRGIRTFSVFTREIEGFSASGVQGGVPRQTQRIEGSPHEPPATRHQSGVPTTVVLVHAQPPHCRFGSASRSLTVEGRSLQGIHPGSVMNASHAVSVLSDSLVSSSATRSNPSPPLAHGLRRGAPRRARCS
jgi:hypothetical protein